MGKRILVQRRGRGNSLIFRASSHKRRARAKYPPFTTEETTAAISFEVIDLIHEPGRGGPLAKIRYEDGTEAHLPAVEGLYCGTSYQQGNKATLEVGNVILLGDIPEGSIISNIELRPGDGGSLVRTSGGYATVRSQTPDGTLVKLPSGQIKLLNKRCRASVGVVGGGGRTERPFLKAGKKWALKKSKGHKYPRVRGCAMNIVSHPFGGGAHQGPHRPTVVSRNAPPGRKVGLIAARRTGRRRGRKG
ncbi:MAG: 50S ribosomal protein L2 [Candidatus Heimdallarchaeota archaeon]